MKIHKVLITLLAVLTVLGMSGCNPTDVPENTNTYTVTFYSDDNTILKVENVLENATAVPPKEPQLTYGKIFRAWDKEFTNVKEDLSVYPVWEETAGKTNVFSVEGVYAQKGDTVMVPVRLGGDVCVSGFDITVSYDPQLLEIVSVTEDGAVVYNDQTPGEVRINYVSVENTVGDVDVCDLKFTVKAESGGIPITLNVNGIYASEYAVESGDDSLYSPSYTVVDGVVYVMA